MTAQTTHSGKPNQAATILRNNSSSGAACLLVKLNAFDRNGEVSDHPLAAWEPTKLLVGGFEAKRYEIPFIT